MPLAAKHLGVPKGEEWSALAPSSPHSPTLSLALPFCLLRFICHFFYCFNMLIAFTALLLLLFFVVVVCVVVAASAVVLLPFSLVPPFWLFFFKFFEIISGQACLRLRSSSTLGLFVGLILRIWPKDFAHYHLLLPLSHHLALSLCFLPSFVMCSVRAKDFPSKIV